MTQRIHQERRGHLPKPLYSAVMVEPEELYQTARRYFRRNPAELARFVRSLLGLRLGLPLDAIRWAAERASRAGSVSDIEVDTVPPGLRIAATVNLMKTPVRAAAEIYFERVRLSGEEIRLDVRLEKVTLALAGESSTPVALLIRSGALDLSRPGNLLRQLPALPPFLVEARDNRIGLDFIKHPKVAENPTVLRVLSFATSVVTLHGIETDEKHVDITFRALPSGVGQAVRAFRQHFLPLAVEKARLLLANGRG
jgi:hypothetical protein